MAGAGEMSRGPPTRVSVHSGRPAGAALIAFGVVIRARKGMVLEVPDPFAWHRQGWSGRAIIAFMAIRSSRLSADASAADHFVMHRSGLCSHLLFCIPPH